MKVLNLYAGIGGNRKLWTDVEVTAVEWDEKIAAIYQDFFPDDKMIVTDAHQYLLEHFKEFDFIWSSPPCPTHSRARYWGLNRGITNPIYPDMRLYQEIIFIKYHFKGKYVVENVIPYYEPLIIPQISGRHCFWTNFNISKFGEYYPKDNSNDLQKIYGFDLSGYTNITERGKTPILRNCVHPKIGLHILECARGIIKSQDVLQKTIFD